MEACVTSESLWEHLREPWSWNWNIVSSLFPSDIPPDDDPRNGWMDQPAQAHSHRHRQVGIVLHGVFRCQTSTGVYDLSPGTAVLFEIGEHHCCVAKPTPIVTPSQVLRLNVFPGHVWIRLQSCGWDERAVVSREEVLSDAETGVMLHEVWSALTHTTPSMAAARWRMVCTLGIICATAYDRYAIGRSTDHTDSRRQLVETLQEHISRNLSHGVTLDDLAAIAGYNKYHLERLFTQVTGQSVHAYIDTCRLSEARKLLNEGHAQKEIATALGFSSYRSLWRWQAAQRKHGREI